MCKGFKNLKQDNSSATTSEQGESTYLPSNQRIHQLWEFGEQNQYPPSLGITPISSWNEDNTEFLKAMLAKRKIWMFLLIKKVFKNRLGRLSICCHIYVCICVYIYVYVYYECVHVRMLIFLPCFLIWYFITVELSSQHGGVGVGAQSQSSGIFALSCSALWSSP